MKANIFITFIMILTMISPIKSTASIEEKKSSQTHEMKNLPIQNFVIYVNESHPYAIQLLVKQKYPYVNEMTAEYKENRFNEQFEISKFVKEISGTITIYSVGEKKEIKKTTLPINPNIEKPISENYYANNDWEGISFGVVTIEEPGNYIISAQLQSKNDRYKELMLGFVGIYGFK
ncbi:hypothetical protein ACMZZG_06510 [Pseudocitrobacter faecalis]|uniref:hypothetical protein n=1 Tax=Pseudocitrobacter faecalis TaxID=1398493 RepID=UPI0039EF06F2